MLRIYVTGRYNKKKKIKIRRHIIDITDFCVDMNPAVINDLFFGQMGVFEYLW